MKRFETTISLILFASAMLISQSHAQLEYSGFQDQAISKLSTHSWSSTALSENQTVEYCIPGANCTFGDGIIDFIFADLQHFSSGCSPDGYGDFTCMQATAEIGENYIASFRSGFDGQQVSMWIDLNNDSTFSAKECLLADLKLTGAGNWYNAAVTIPVYATPGIYRLRIGSNWMAPSSADPCGEFSYGEWEDYHIQIAGEPIQVNVAVIRINMDPIMASGELTPWATIQNQGVDSAIVYITMRENTLGYSSTKYVWKLAPGVSYQLKFDTLDIMPGIYNFSVKTDLEGDEIPEDDSLSMAVTFTDQPRQKVIAEFFTGTWNPNCPIAAEGLDLLKQNYTDTLAVIAWHIGDEFEAPGGIARDALYRIGGYPTVWFDGWENVIGAFPPDNYTYFDNKMEKRVPHPSNFEVSVVLTEVDKSKLNVNSTVEIRQGNSIENLAAFVVLTESDLEFPGPEKQNFVARKVYPDVTGLPLDFSSQTIHSWDTEVVFKDDYDTENCEIVVFIQNMDTKEIYQGNSRMAGDVTSIDDMGQSAGLTVYPNPARDRLTIKSNHQILRVSVFNSLGQRVHEIKGMGNILNLSTVAFEPGMYLFRVQTAEGDFTQIVVIE